MKTALAFLEFDLDAESGRAVLGLLRNDRIELKEIHRFPNGPVQLGNSLHWDVLGLWEEMNHGLAFAVREAGDSLIRLGVVTGHELIVDASLLPAWYAHDPGATGQAVASRRRRRGHFP